MHLKVITDPKGVTTLYMYETVRYMDEAGQWHTTSKKRETFGRLDELQKLYSDPIAHFREVCKQRTVEKQEADVRDVKIDMDTDMAMTTDACKNVGYGILKRLYLDLELDTFWHGKTQHLSLGFSADRIFRLLVLDRILYPDAKEPFEGLKRSFEGLKDLKIQNVYACLDVIARFAEDLQKWIYDHATNICSRDMSVTYFYRTNYCFDIGRPGADEEGSPVDIQADRGDAMSRGRGPEKDRRPDPIVEMGLLMDKTGIPLAFDLYPGSRPEQVHTRPILDRVKQQCPDCRTIVVSDRGLLRSEDLCSSSGDDEQEDGSRDGYVYGRSVCGADAAFQAWVLHGDLVKEEIGRDGWGRPIWFEHKSRILEKGIHVQVTEPGTKEPSTRTVQVAQKQMVYRSEEHAKKQRADRAAMVACAKDLKHPDRYDKVTADGCTAYGKGISFDKTTGKEPLLDEEKIREEEKYDGYCAIVTSELDMSDEEMRDIYRGLGKIEDAFQVSRSEKEPRPGFEWTNEHILAHFVTCYTALILIRLLAAKLGHIASTEKIIESLKRYDCVLLEPGLYSFMYYDEILDACSKAFQMDLSRQYRTQKEMRRLLRY